MQQQWTYYDVLGIGPGATQEEIRVAYRRQAWQHHPDRGGSPAFMVAINNAWDVLRDPERRADYDIELASDRAPQTAQAPLRVFRPWKDRLAASVLLLAVAFYGYLLWSVHQDRDPWGAAFVALITPEYFCGAIYVWISFREMLGD
jgi:curved DNA-binding protein CbpA